MLGLLIQIILILKIKLMQLLILIWKIEILILTILVFLDRVLMQIEILILDNRFKILMLIMVYLNLQIAKDQEILMEMLLLIQIKDFL